MKTVQVKPQTISSACFIQNQKSWTGRTTSKKESAVDIGYKYWELSSCYNFPLVLDTLWT